MKFELILTLLAINVTLGDKGLASQFNLCTRSDPKINECLKTAINNALPILKKGLPDYDMASIEPFRVPNWTISAVQPLNFIQAYQNITLWNHISADIQEVQATVSEQKFAITLKFYISEGTHAADYNYQNAVFDGLDMSSMGKFRADVKDYSGTVSLDGEITKRGDVDYVLITNVTTFNVNIDYLHMSYITNEPEPGKLLTEHFNSNWYEIEKKTESRYIEMFSEGYKNAANAVFARIPYDVLFPK